MVAGNQPGEWDFNNFPADPSITWKSTLPPFNCQPLKQLCFSHNLLSDETCVL